MSLELYQERYYQHRRLTDLNSTSQAPRQDRPQRTRRRQFPVLLLRRYRSGGGGHRVSGDLLLELRCCLAAAAKVDNDFKKTCVMQRASDFAERGKHAPSPVPSIFDDDDVSSL